MFDHLERIFSNRDGGERSLRANTGHDTNPVFDTIQAHLLGITSEEEIDNDDGDPTSDACVPPSLPMAVPS